MGADSEFYTSSDESIKFTESSDEAAKPSTKKTSHICPHDDCKATFSKRNKLVYHIRRHTGERPFVCDVPNCGKSYLYSFHLRRHKDISHEGLKSNERISCPFEGCFLQLANKYSLKKHIKIKHDPERNYPFSCKECKQGFHRKRQLLQHSYTHTGILPYKCDLCEAAFLIQRDLNRHKRTHTTYSCSCEQKFERWSTFLEHRKKCESSKLKCGVCCKTFICESTLKIHRLKHKNERTYKCGHENCDRDYLHKRNLIHHVQKVHQKVQLERVTCTQANCQRTFTRNQTLLKHIALCHSGKRRAEKKSRRSRKDIGIPKVSATSSLSGLKLPPQINRDVICGISVNVPESIVKSASTSEEVTMDEKCVNKNSITECMLLIAENEPVTSQIANVNFNAAKA